MAKRLIAFADEHPEQALAWRIVDDEGRVESGGECVIEDLPRMGGGAVVLVLPGDRVSVQRAVLTARNDKQLRAAAPFAIEDDVATDLDDVHIALGPVDSVGAKRALHVVATEYLDMWLNAFEGSGFTIMDVSADHALLPNSDNIAQVLALPQRWIASADQWSGSVDRHLGQDVLEAVLASVQPDAETEAGPDMEMLEVGDAFDYLAARTIDKHVSLLQGAYQRRNASEGAAMDWRRWRLPGALVAACGLFAIAGTAFEGAALRQKSDEARAQTETIFREAFPQVSRVVNPRAQLRTQLAGREGGASEFLELSSMLAGAVEDNEGVDVQAMRYDRGQSELQVSIAFKSYGDLTQLKDRIIASGGAVQEGGSRQSGDLRLGEITVTQP
ncbi:MAG: hypothetical protein CME88_17120 [Hirschia sp.]|nr:hypothetical protein [Hirschia sp.]